MTEKDDKRSWGLKRDAEAAEVDRKRTTGRNKSRDARKTERKHRGTTENVENIEQRRGYPIDAGRTEGINRRWRRVEKIRKRNWSGDVGRIEQRSGGYYKYLEDRDEVAEI